MNETNGQETEDGRLPVYRAETPDLASMSLAGLRRALARAQDELRDAEDTEQYERAATETRAIAAVSGDHGKNDADRKRYLILALERDDAYQGVLIHLRAAQERVDLLKADLEIRIDARRDRELEVRDKLATALLAVAARNTTEAGDQAAENETVDSAWERYVKARNGRRVGLPATGTGAELGG